MAENPRRYLMTAMAAVCLAALAVSPASAQIKRGPYLQKLQTTSIMVVWEGGAVDGPRVHFGRSNPDEDSAGCTCAGSHCSCEIGGLDPATEYVYEVRGGGEAISSKARFRTAPNGEERFSFLVFGDNRSDHASHMLVVQSLVEGAAFIMNTGDMVSSGEVEEDWDKFFEVEAPLLANTVIYPAVGNHEEHDGKVEIYDRLFHPPSTESNSNHKTYYSFDYANAHFVVIDDFVRIRDWYLCITYGRGLDGCLDPEQADWLKLDLERAARDDSIDHVFVFMHEGPYSSKPGRTGSDEMRWWMPTFAQNKVKVIFSGHDHYYEHGISGNGLHYVISGGGGAPLYDRDPGQALNALWPHQIIEGAEAHNYQVVTVDGGHIKVVTHNVDSATVLEEFEIGEAPGCSTPEDCASEQAGACDGEWACKDRKCLWECAPPPTCKTEADCGDPPDGACAGHYECLTGGTCRWGCDPDPECKVPVDCANRQALTDCTGGHYMCPDEVCEWVCPGGGDASGGTPEADAGSAPGTGSGGEGGEGGEPTPGSGGDGEPAADDEAGGIERTSGGCGAVGPVAPPAPWIALFALAWLVWRRRRAGER
jgi:acid phosphatase type 7